MQPLALTLKGFRGIRDGLGRDEITLDLERLTQDAQLIAIVGANGSGKSTIMDCLTSLMLISECQPGVLVTCGRAVPNENHPWLDAPDFREGGLAKTATVRSLTEPSLSSLAASNLSCSPSGLARRGVCHPVVGQLRKQVTRRPLRGR
jgi:energy-coupling factor transporter ATP-binding protein EcfA2